jgi:predicted RNA-binding protein
MALTEIKATKKIGDVEKVAAVAYDFGDNLDQAVEKFGADVVFTNFKRTAVITAQAAIRRMLEDNKSDEEITSKMSQWKPGVALERVIDPVASLVGKWDSYTQEEQNEILKKLRSKSKK